MATATDVTAPTTGPPLPGIGVCFLLPRSRLAKRTVRASFLAAAAAAAHVVVSPFCLLFLHFHVEGSWPASARKAREAECNVILGKLLNFQKIHLLCFSSSNF